MDQRETNKRNQKILKIISEFDTKFSSMSESDQKTFAESWVQKLKTKD